MLSPMRSIPFVVGAGALVLGAVVAGCGNDDATTPAPAGDVAGELRVFATASLTAAFTELGEAFIGANPDVDLIFNFAAASQLVTQIGEGAPADVFASADQPTMARLTEAGNNASEPVVFTTNSAQIVVEAGNPQGITDVADLARPGLIAIACAPDAPCGRYAKQVLDNAGVTVEFRSLEENVRAVVSKVMLGEADAGIVYVTDVINAGDAVAGVPIPDALNVVAEYPIAVTRGASNPTAAQAFVDFVLSDEGQAILESHGFVSP
jgi:molybdate transport system substrate-binding protein